MLLNTAPPAQHKHKGKVVTVGKTILSYEIRAANEVGDSKLDSEDEASLAVQHSTAQHN